MDRKEYRRQYRIQHREHELALQRERRHKESVPCPNCGKPKKPASKLCRPCGYLASRGQRSPHWKGGRLKHSGGYIIVYKPEHPRASKQGYVLEHIFIWEQAHNKPVSKGWEVHHYNGIKDDNRPCNLFAKTKKEHRLIIPELQKRIQQLEASLNNQYHLL
ncbi:hypothetical protein LCGC14_2835830 [marine sediment metagenome]|uniref:HNH nuclease domain-containing protein n=1 Tax=marine sediment metagenome TaxID=412755 RepID=A0A0F8YCL4_9ZZZZ